MKAFIKEDKWEEFKYNYTDFKFSLLYSPNKFYTKVIDSELHLIVSRKTRELLLVTPMGTSPFMEVHKKFYQDLYDQGFVEYVKGKFD